MNHENRVHYRLEKYWDALRGGRPFPSESEINPDDIADIWNACFLISIDDVTRRCGYRYSYLGQSLIEAYGEDLYHPGVVSTLISTNNEPITHKFDEVLKTQKPVTDESTFVNLKNLKIKYRTCLLPLGPEAGKVSHIIGSMRWKEY